MTRSEFEYPLPVDDAAILLDQLCEQPLIDKHRHVEQHGGKTWEIDVFHGDNEGLVVAEVELASEDEKLELPAWVGRRSLERSPLLQLEPVEEPVQATGRTSNGPVPTRNRTGR